MNKLPIIGSFARGIPLPGGNSQSKNDEGCIPSSRTTKQQSTINRSVPWRAWREEKNESLAKCAKIAKKREEGRISRKGRKGRKEEGRKEETLAKSARHAEESLIPQQLNNPTTGNSPLRVLRGKKNDLSQSPKVHPVHKM